MNPSDDGKNRGRRRRTLDITRIKVVVVVLTGAIVGLLSSLAGQGSQLAFSPALSWMLGFKTEKAHATAMRYALAAALTAVIGFGIKNHVIVYLLQYGVLLFAGATFGALISAALVKTDTEAPSRSIFQAAAMFLCVFVLVRTVRLTPFDQPYFTHWHSSLAFLGTGFVVGAISQLTGIASGILLYPALIYLFALTARDAVITSLIVVALAGILPSWSYSKRGLIDAQYGGAALAGGLAGGVITSIVIPNISEKMLLILFSLFSMFLCAREMARISSSTKSQSNNLKI